MPPPFRPSSPPPRPRPAPRAACRLLLEASPQLLWVRCAGLTPFDMALHHCNLALAETLAAAMGPQQVVRGASGGGRDAG